MRMKILTIVLGTILMVGCNTIEQPTVELGAISFGTNMIDLSTGRSTRALVDNEALTGSDFAVYVTAVMNGSQRLYPVSGTSNGERISRDAQTAKWLPYNIKTWQSGNTYSFNGFTYLPTGATSNGSLTIETLGRQIRVNQPETYNQETMVDYLYSHTFSVSDGRLRPVVQLDLEHAMALVEVRIAKHESIGDAYLDEVRVENFWRSATMNCQSPAVCNSGQSNVWEVSFTAGTEKNTTYSRSGRHPQDAGASEPLVPLAERDQEESVLLSFVAIPQKMEATNLLTVSFWVNEKFDQYSPDNYVHHEATFELYDYTPLFWQSGHRITYVLEVDTGIRLRGVINPWVDVDYIEGTVLPEQK
jgi:hypothetical protein